MFSCGETLEADISQTVQFEGRIYLLKSEEPFSGILYHNYPNGKKEYETSYKNGKPNGDLIYWYESGNLMRKGQLKDGTPVGRWTYYDSTGQIQEIVDH